MTTVLVSGTMVTKHGNGGEPWVRLSWVLGLQRLGFNVYFVEQIDPGQCLDEWGVATDFERCVNLRAFRQIVRQFGLESRSALIGADGCHAHGMTWAELSDLAEDAALLVNITGNLTLPSLRNRIRRAAYIDEDPGFTQIWQSEGSLGHLLDGHDAYYTVGLNVGSPDCSIPTAGLTWRTLRQPVVLDCWPVAADGDRARLTTVAAWRGAYGTIEYQGRTFGPRAHQFRKLIDLPQHIPQVCELALDIHAADENDRSALTDHGWRIVNPRAVAADPHSFRQYVQASGGEISVAQTIYVDTNSGWFSDRTVRYLASARPALVQDTGFSHHLPSGEGLVAFRTLDGAVRGAEAIARDYEGHRQAARAVAERFFDSDLVLGQFMAEQGVAP